MKKISGVGKRHILKNFFKRINSPYDLHIRNAIDGSEILHLALTKKSVYILISTFLVISFFLVSLLFLFTPIKYYIPGYETNASRKKMIELRAKVDELQAYQNKYNKVMNNMIAVAKDDESVLLDTVALSENQLQSAEMANEQQMATDRGKRRVIGSRPIDTSKVKSTIKKSKSSTKSVQQAVETKSKRPKKRDTIITYK